MADFLKQYYNNYFLGSLDRTLACLRKNVEAGILKPTVAVQILKRGLKQDRCLKLTKVMIWTVPNENFIKWREPKGGLI